MLKNIFLALCCSLALAACVTASGPSTYIGGVEYTNSKEYIRENERDDYDMRMGRYSNTHRYGAGMAGSSWERNKGPYNR